MFGKTPMSRAEKLLIELEQKIAELNGDPDAIRNAVQEYLESHPEAFNVIDDSAASESKTYSSSKIMDLIGEIDIPVPSQPYEIVPLGNHSYDYHTDILDYGFAKQYMKENGVAIGGGCSSVRKGNVYGRKFDWFYDNHVEFRVFTEANTFRHGVLGTAAVLDITKNDVTSTEYNELLRIVPFALVDGVNDAGVFMNVNVVPQDYGTTTLVEATTVSKEEISAAMLVRFVLDRFGDATTAANYLMHYVDIYMPEKMNEMNYELHWMLGDKTSTYCLEFIEGSLEILDISAHPYMTNFHLYDVTLDANGKVTINHDGEPNESGVTELGSGLERFNIIADAYSGLVDSTDWESLMSDLDYTNAYNEYTDPFWYTEFVGYNNLTCSSPVADYASVVSTAIYRFVNRDRDAANTWITCHSLLADLDSLEMNYIFQEDYSNEHTAFVPTKSSGGTLDPEEVEEIVSGYLEDHPELFEILDDSESYSQTKGWTSKKIVDNLESSLTAAMSDISTELAGVLSTKANAIHTHDDRYYTETEVDALISGVEDSLESKADLDSNGRIPYSQLPESAMELKGTWNASTNTPTLANGTGTNGDFYIVTTDGTWNGVAYAVNDRILYVGATSTWTKLAGGDITSKADKVSGATSGNFAGLDSNGNLTDSGKSVSDLLTVSGDGSIFSTHKYVNIPDGTDLNNIKAPGTYGTAGYDGTTNIVNSPFGNNPFSLLVENQMKAGQGFIRQIAKKYNANTVMIRYSNDTGSTWSDWASFAMSTETKPAWQISSGTFLGQVNADATSAANIGTFQMRDIQITSTEPTEGSSLASGKIVFVVD